MHDPYASLFVSHEEAEAMRQKEDEHGISYRLALLILEAPRPAGIDRPPSYYWTWAPHFAVDHPLRAPQTRSVARIAYVPVGFTPNVHLPHSQYDRISDAVHGIAQKFRHHVYICRLGKPKEALP